MTMDRSVEGVENVSHFDWQPAMNENMCAVLLHYIVIHEYEKSHDLTPSILQAKSESLHQCEMKNKVGR